MTCICLFIFIHVVVWGWVGGSSVGLSQYLVELQLLNALSSAGLCFEFVLAQLTGTPHDDRSSLVHWYVLISNLMMKWLLYIITLLWLDYTWGLGGWLWLDCLLACMSVSPTSPDYNWGLNLASTDATRWWNFIEVWLVSCMSDSCSSDRQVFDWSCFADA